MPRPNMDLKPQLIGKTQVITGLVRLSFVNVLVPKEDLKGEMKYGCTLLIDKDDPVLTFMKVAMKNAATERWGDKIPAGLRSPLRDGSEKPEYDGYEGKIFTNVTSKQRPGIVGLDGKTPITSEEEIYSGCWARVDINCFAYDQKGNKGVSFGLNNIQKLGDDERFSGRQPAEKVFSPVVDATAPFGGEENGDPADMFA